MKILIFSNEFPPFVGGAGVVAKQNARALSLGGHKVTVLTRKRSDTVPDGPYEIVEAPVFSKLWFLSYRKAVDFASFDLIFLNDLPSVYVAGLFFSSVAFSKSVIFLHGSEPEILFEKISFARKVSFFKQIYISSLRRCKRICAVSNYMKTMFLAKTNMIEFQEKIFVYYAGIDLQLFFPEKDNNFKLERNIPEDATVLLSISRIEEDKGYYDKFCLFKELYEKENLFWIVVGDGAYLDELKNLSVENGLGNRVIFTGAKRREELRTFFSNADIFWLLSNRDGESFGLVYVESQACGVPAIGRNRAGAVEAISNGVSGFLVDNDEQVKNIIKSRLYSKLLKSNILVFANKFKVENQAEELLEQCFGSF